MKKLFILLGFLLIYFDGNSQNVGIGTPAPNTSAKLDVTSTSSGFLPPRMTTSARDLIPTPAPGLMIYNTTTNAIEFFNGTSWYNISNAITSAVDASSPINKLLGSNGNESIAGAYLTSDGGYILACYYSNNSAANGMLAGIPAYGGYDIWIVKLDVRGNLVWQKLLGGSGQEFVRSIQQTSDGGYIVAGFSNSTNSGLMTGLTGNGLNDFYIIKLDGTGNIVWQKLLGGSTDEEANAVQQTSDGGYIVAGFSASSNTGTLTGVFTNGLKDLWIIKLDATGTVIWQKLLGGSSDEMAYALEQTPDGGYIVVGAASSSNSGTLTGFTSNGVGDGWIIKLNGVGTVQWQKLFGGNSSDEFRDIHQTADGGFISAGYSSSSNTGTLSGITANGNGDFWVIKMDAAGTLQWQKLIGGSGFDFATSVSLTTNGGFIVAGQSNSSNSGNLLGMSTAGQSDGYIVKLDGTGSIQWQRLFGGTYNDAANNIFQIANGDFFMAGLSNSLPTVVNTGTLSGIPVYGNGDAWILKLDKYGNPY